MSMEVRLMNGSSVESSFIGPMSITGVRIGNNEIPLQDFGVMAAHFLMGGFFGWGGETPEAVSECLTVLFDRYERKGDKWELKDSRRPANSI